MKWMVNYYIIMESAFPTKVIMKGWALSTHYGNGQETPLGVAQGLQ